MVNSTLARTAAVLAALLMPAAATASPQAPAAPTEAKAAATLSDAEIHLLTDLHATNGMEIEMGALARTRGGAKAVKSYGKLMVTDHTKADKDVLALARSRGVTLAAHPTPRDDAEKAQMDKDMATMERLKTLEGAAFDRELVTAMVDGHGRAIARVSAARSSITDPRLKALVTRLLPTLDMHHEKAKALAVAAP
jgi:putative membrane protein